MSSPLVTEVAAPTVSILFNDKAGPAQVADIVSRQHAFVEYEMYETKDESERSAWLLLVYCETASQQEIMQMIGSRLPDYIQPRVFPPSRVEAIRRSGTPS
jgi:hypothetical protein